MLIVKYRSIPPGLWATIGLQKKVLPDCVRTLHWYALMDSFVLDFVYLYSRFSKAAKLCRAVPNFESIRPYRDEEVPSVVRRLINSVELRNGIASFLFPRLYSFSSVATQHLAALILRFRARRLRTVHDVQMMVRRFIDHMVRASVDELSWSGLADLDRDQSYLFVSNHRDITLDSALLNRVLHEEGFPTCQIAVGDNLFGTPFADDLMRLNRGFLVERAAGGPKKIYAALMRTSAFIRQSLEGGTSVWIAQREGRAKDGFDRTEPALLKMLALAWRKSRTDVGSKRKISQLDELLQVMRIVPVAISYELDPCDLLKADELYEVATAGGFTKPEGADLASIVAGMRGYKGRVHLHFSKPLTGHYESAEAIARAMDEAIVGGLKIYPSNVNAWAAQGGVGGMSGVGVNEASKRAASASSKALDFFDARVIGVSAEKQPYLLLQYANLLRNRLELGLETHSELGADVADLKLAQISSR